MYNECTIDLRQMREKFTIIQSMIFAEQVPIRSSHLASHEYFYVLLLVIFIVW